MTSQNNYSHSLISWCVQVIQFPKSSINGIIHFMIKKKSNLLCLLNIQPINSDPPPPNTHKTTIPNDVPSSMQTVRSSSTVLQCTHSPQSHVSFSPDKLNRASAHSGPARDTIKRIAAIVVKISAITYKKISSTCSYSYKNMSLHTKMFFLSINSTYYSTHRFIIKTPLIITN